MRPIGEWLEYQKYKYTNDLNNIIDVDTTNDNGEEVLDFITAFDNVNHSKLVQTVQQWC